MIYDGLTTPYSFSPFTLSPLEYYIILRTLIFGKVENQVNIFPEELSFHSFLSIHTIHPEEVMESVLFISFGYQKRENLRRVLRLFAHSIHLLKI